MQIVSSAISLNSERAFVQGSNTQERLSVVNGGARLDAERSSQEFRVEGSRSRSLALMDTIDLSSGNEDGVDTRGPGLMQTLAEVGQGVETADVEEGQLGVKEGSKLSLTKKILEVMFEKKIDVTRVSFGKLDEDDQASISRLGALAEQAQSLAGGGGGGNFGLAFDRSVTTFEAEQTSFQAAGVVKTADGREINFAVELEMAREFVSREDTSIRMGQLKDPLVVNFGGEAAALTDEKFEFDIDADGQQDSVSFLKSNSGFLAFDRNNDGVINNGSELFGPSTGDGFAELAAYDEDGNNFIDGGDSIYSSLSVYNKAADGSDQLRSLSDAGVGAIYLDRADTEFSLNNQQTNEQLGQVRTSSVFIGEAGDVGTVQQVDLTV